MLPVRVGPRAQLVIPYTARLKGIKNGECAISSEVEQRTFNTRVASSKLAWRTLDWHVPGREVKQFNRESGSDAAAKDPDFQICT